MLPFAKQALANLFKKPSTVRFPEVEVDAKPAYRGRIRYDAEKCVNCGMCIKICSPAAITRTSEPAEGGENITYTFDLTSCTFCGSCQDFCSTKAITLSEDYHMVAENAADLKVTGTRFRKTVQGKVTLKKENCVYCGLCAKNCPESAITVDRATKTWTLNEEECVKCGRCIEKCPKKALSFEEPKEEGVLMGDACVYCTLCAKSCPVGAITVDRASKTWEIDRSQCIHCGQCVSICPRKTLRMGEVDESTPSRYCAADKAAAPAAKQSPAAAKAEAPVKEASVQAAPAPKAQPTATASRPAEPVFAAPIPEGLIPKAAYTWEEGVRLGPDCIHCTACARKCPMEAITVDRAAGTWAINREKCVLCGICVGICPKKTLSIGPLENEAAPDAAPASQLKVSAAEPVKATAPAEKATGIRCADGCIQCGACAATCPAGAITVEGEWQINRDACVQCGACISACPVSVLSMGEIE